MYKVLVTGVGSNIGQGIIKSLRMSKFQCQVVGVDMNALSAGLFRCNKGYIVPPATDERFIPEIIRICKDEKIDIILIGSDAEVPILSHNKSVIENSCEARVIVSEPKVVDIAFDKWSTVTFLREGGLNYPRSALGTRKEDIEQIIRVCGFPLIVKPRKGAGSKDIFKVHNRDKLAYFLKFVEDPIIQEELGSEDEEYTTGVFFSRDSEVKGIISMKRELLSGTTYRAFIDDYAEVEPEVERVAYALGKLGALGPINIQLRLTPKGAVTFEINPRFSGTTVFRAKLGFNESEAAIRNFLLKEDLARLTYSTGVVMRYWEEVYTSIEEVTRLKVRGYLENPESEISQLL